MTWGIGIDIGGTAIKAVAADRNGHLLHRITQLTYDKSDTIHTWVNHSRRMIAEFEDRVGTEAPAIGIGSPGLASRDQRSIACLPGKLEGFEGFDWTRGLERDTLVPVVNDAHAALLGEAWIGAARGRKEVVLLTLGTGVGGAITSNGRLVKGGIGRAGHLGHMSMDIDGPLSICGMPGATEVKIGNATIVERSGGQFTSTQELVEAYQAGDGVATHVWLESMRALGCAIASYINILDPEVVVLTGGLTIAGNALMEPLQSVLDEVEWRPGGHQVPVIFGKLDKWAGAVGAVYAALHPDTH